MLPQTFLNHGCGESKSEFVRRLHDVLQDPHVGEGYMVSDTTGPVAMMVLLRNRGYAVEVSLLRVVESSLSMTLACHLLSKAVETAIVDASPVTVLKDACCPSHVRDACEKLAFVKAEHGWVKLNLTGIRTLQRAADDIATLGATRRDLDYPSKIVAGMLDSCRRTAPSPCQLAETEHLLWPMKLDSTQLASFLVPIKCEWAKHLFDRAMAAEDLLAVDTLLSLRHENVYYRSARPRVMVAPSRVLWYVGNDRNYSGTATIRACSLVDEVVVGPAKQVFKRFSRLGVFKWRDVLAVARGNSEGDILAFRFSGTELFSRPVPSKQIRRVFQAHRNTRPQFTTALLLRPGEFAELYSMGLGSIQKGTT
jgi:hypothetical protein